MDELPQSIRVEIARQSMQKQIDENKLEDIINRVREKDRMDTQKRIRRIIFWGIIGFILYTLFGGFVINNFIN